MFRRSRLVFLFPLLIFLLSGCENGIVPEAKRVTFALVLDDNTLYLGDSVIAEVRDHDASGTLLETLSAPLVQYPNAPGTSWAQLTTLGEVETNHRYHLTFYIDRDASGTLSSGDQSGILTFDVMPNAVWCERNFFKKDLFQEP